VLDTDDSSLTRSHKYFMHLFEDALAGDGRGGASTGGKSGSQTYAFGVKRS